MGCVMKIMWKQQKQQNNLICDKPVNGFCVYIKTTRLSFSHQLAHKLLLLSPSL